MTGRALRSGCILWTLWCRESGFIEKWITCLSGVGVADAVGVDSIVVVVDGVVGAVVDPSDSLRL